MGNLEETRPRTTDLFLGKCFKGSKVPARSVSYSSYIERGHVKENEIVEIIQTYVESIHVDFVEQLDRDAVVATFTEVHAILYEVNN